MNHELKTWPAYFEAVACGDKTFEVRENSDRGFQKGDTVTLREYNKNCAFYSGRTLDLKITYVTNFMQNSGYVVFGFICMSKSPIVGE